MKIKRCIICEIEFTHKNPIKTTCSIECSYAARALTRKKSRTAEDGTIKSCEDCCQEFIDATRDQKMMTCRDCSSMRMAKTRKENGSYVRSEEQNQKLSDSLNKKISEGWNANTPAHREKLSRLMKERWEEGKMQNPDIPHWTKTEDGKKRLSIQHKGKKMSASSRKKMSEAASERVRTGLLKYHRGNGGIREDLGFYVRSSWEANFARILRYEGKNFEYESVSFTLSDGKTYTPDFKVGDVFYEIKGYMTDAAKRKISMFAEEYPSYILNIVDYEEYCRLKDKFENLINWEKSK